MKQYRITIDGRIYEVQIDDPLARPVTARLSGVAFSVDVETMRPITDADDERGDHAALADDAPPGGAIVGAGAGDDLATGTAVTAQQSLPAPIPGVVSSVAVTTGQAVERGDELLTIEAMKMVNVIRSPWAGTVATVHVTEGKRVSQGEPLVTFRPT